ncbi:MAG: hypothetical protein AB7S80_10910 [Rhizobiaceae bacterium]
MDQPPDTQPFLDFFFFDAMTTRLVSCAADVSMPCVAARSTPGRAGDAVRVEPHLEQPQFRLQPLR